MTPPGKTVCLCMIVKNEAPVIRRCLGSVRPIIDRWLIVDTGSTDGTQDIVRAAMADLPGELVERPWHDFATNRTESLTLARPWGDYSLIIDADDVLEIPVGYSLPELADDSYVIDIVFGATLYQRPHLVKASLGWRYVGVLHEYLECEKAKTKGHLPIIMRIVSDGARRHDPETYKRDAQVLEAALTTETDPFLIARYTFYLAQSYRDCGQHALAVQAYLRRATMGFWREEVFISFYQAGRMMESLGSDPDQVIETYRRASAAVPTRAEAAHAASRFCRGIGRNEDGYAVAKAAIDLTAPADGLFVEAWIYQYGLADEFAVNAYWAGHHDDSLDACLRMLASNALPSADRPRIAENARLAANALRRPGSWPEDAPLPALARTLSTRAIHPAPRVLIAILAKQKEPVIPLFLKCIEALDYLKSSIVLYIRTNNNTDRTREILRDWVDRVGPLYAGVEFDDADLALDIEQFAVHDWNATRLSIIRAIRNVSLGKTVDHHCDFFFAIDVDNFVIPSTLRELVALDLPIVAPLIREAKAGARYANYHAKIDDTGYFLDSPRYDEILYRRITGLIEVPVVHCTYLVRADVVGRLGYEDGSGRFDYVIFSHQARLNGIPQYLDNRQLYGYLTLEEDLPDIVGPQLTKIAEDLDTILASS